jgi:starvation-inducible DNA-binding protein
MKTCLKPAFTFEPKKVDALVRPIFFNSIDLWTQVKSAHWNVTGSNFVALHELFDEIAGRLDAQTDLLAERIRQIGLTAFGTTRRIASELSLPEFEEVQSSQEVLNSIISSMSAQQTLVAEAIYKSDEIGDPATADILTEILRELDKDIWFLRSHLD